jgi:hypothetical protein
MINDNGTPLVVIDDYPVGPGIYEISGGLFNIPTPHVSVYIQIIPEPATIVLLGVGMIGVILRRQGCEK